MTGNEITTVEPSDLERPKDYQGLLKLAETVTSTELCPAAYKGKPKDAAIAMMMAAEVGANPVTSLAYLAVVNGRPSWYSDALPGIAKAQGVITGYKEWYEGEPYDDEYKAVCEVYTPDGLSYQDEFSVSDAKKAKLWGKSGPWTNYPKRMMRWRARSWAIRSAAPEMMFGATYEELRDENTRHRGPERAKTINVNTDAPKREIVTMTGSATTEIEDAADQQAAEQVKPEDQPKRSIKDIVMLLANTESLDEVSEIETMLAEKRDGMKPAHVNGIERAIAEARSRLMVDETSNADTYAERIMNGGNLVEIQEEIEADKSLSDGDRQTLTGMIQEYAGEPA